MHTIRLRGPWHYEPVARFDIVGNDAAGNSIKDNLPPAGKQKMPADWTSTLGADFHGKVRYRRTFHAPTGLEAGQGVGLVVEEGATVLAVWLNNRPLIPALAPAPGNSRFAIEQLLQPTNQLLIEVEHRAADPGVGGLTGEVRLEIETVRPRPVD